MSTRRTIERLVTCDEDTFHSDAPEFLSQHGLDPERVERADGDLDSLVEGLDAAAIAGLSSFERRLLRRLWVLDRGPLALTLAGPKYQDNPVIYVTQRFRELTGYSLGDVRGENLRLLQGADTEAAAVDALREAVDIWEPVTVELWNYRADGTRFRNRVSLVPCSDDTGTVTNWVGIQGRVDE